MTVELKLNCQDFTGELREGEYDLPGGATVRQLIEAAFLEAGRDMPESVEGSLIFLYNNRHADWDTPLDGGKLRVLYKVLGG